MLYSGYKSQLDRVRRCLDKLGQQEVDSTEYEDRMFTYFQQCWALKDWIKNDKNVAQNIRNTIENEVKKFQNILIAADLANKSKHLALDRPPRVGADFAGVDVTITVKPLGPEESHGPAAVSHQYRVDDDQGNKLGDALTIANDAFREWESLLDRLGLPY